ncbi:tripartite motif-containing protein 35 [Esox lucius]|uniref:Zinc-binding protein A33-like n=1 Tax=Esox lucius TaxID=8010 RepID=A0A3P8YIW6_ESOLU|nr:tripartite motif-containing protein 35 [Esox lucius]
MASRSSLPVEDLSCPVCYDIFKDPVLLSCSHSFCKACLDLCWKGKENKECPVCQTICPVDPHPNLALKNLCESFLRSQRDPTRQSAGSEALCSLHSEKLKLFCLEDEQPICLVCRDSKTHKHHNCIPVDEAVKIYTEEIWNAQKPLQEKLKIFEDVKQIWDKSAKHIKNQAQQAETQIKEDFEKLRQFLREEEEVKIAALNEEEKQKSQMMKNKVKEISKEISSLLGKTRSIEEELKAEDIIFLQNFKATKERAQCTLPDPQVGPGELIDMTKHLSNLQFRVWEKMQGIIKHTPVILDPNTANAWLSLSDDLTSVRNTDKQQPPNNPERFTYHTVVLASEGFSTGRPSWEIEVGDHPRWSLGVAKESIDRKGEVFASPKSGIWAVMQMSGEYTNGMSETLTLKRRPNRIQVQLDYERGTVSFYDSEDMTLIYTHKDTFTDKLYPYFCIGPAGDAKNPDIQICQSEVSLTVKTSQLIHKPAGHTSYFWSLWGGKV